MTQSLDAAMIARIVKNMPMEEAAELIAMFDELETRKQVQQCHELMNSLGIEHFYSDGPQVKHHWNTGWAAWSGRLLSRPSFFLSNCCTL